MKTLVYLLLFMLPLAAFGQSSSTDGVDIDLKFLGTTGGETDITKVQVNDTIRLALDLQNLDSTYGITYVHTDVEYNKNAYTILDPVWNISNAQNSSFVYTDTKWTVNTNYDENDLWAQWSQGGGSYGTVTGWDVWHYTTQHTTSFDGEYIELRFKVKSTDASNYAKAIKVTMAKVDDNTQTYTYPIGKVRGYATQWISNVPLEDFDNNVYLKVEFNSNVDPTKFEVDIYKNGTVTGTVDLDANGQAVVTEWVNSSTDTYKFDFKWQGTEAELTSVFDNGVTISDAVLLLKETGGFEHGDYGNAFDYPIQYLATDFDNNSEIESQDSYTLLAHVVGVEGGNVFVNNELNNVDAFAFVKESEYDDLTFENWQAANVGTTEDFTVDLSNGDINLPYSTALYADANLSHGIVPSEAAATVAYSSQPTTARASTQQYGENKYTNSTVDANLISELKDGELHVHIEVLGEDTAALQLKLGYDATRLQFKEVVFDTGNTTTNFGSADYTRVSLGSIHQNGGALPKNSKMTAIFTPLEAVTSAAGLVTIINTDAAGTDGLQQILNIQ